MLVISEARVRQSTLRAIAFVYSLSYICSFFYFSSCVCVYVWVCVCFFLLFLFLATTFYNTIDPNGAEQKSINLIRIEAS